MTLAFKTGKVSGNWHPIAAFHDNIAVRLVSVEIPTGGRSGVLVFIIALAAAGIMALSRRVG